MDLKTIPPCKPCCILYLSLVVLSGLMLSATGAAPVRAAGPTVIRGTVRIVPWRLTQYWKNKNASEPEWDTWCWIPRIKFQVQGPIPGGSQVVVEYTLPDGKQWMEQNLYTEEIGAEEYTWLATNDDREKSGEKDATLATGVFTYKIKLTNELTGTNDVLMSGRFKVEKFHKGLAQFKNQFEYYVDQDWRMPIGWLWLDGRSNDRMPYLKVGMWMRGQWSSSELAAYLMKDGKTVASTKEQYGGAEATIDLTTMDDASDDPKWSFWEFEWRGVFGFDHDGSISDRSDIYELDKNPGQYDIKVLYGGKLVRTASFTVGADGAIVDNGLVAQNNLRTASKLLPIKVVGDRDGKYDQNAWKTEAFYGNPLIGFTAP